MSVELEKPMIRFWEVLEMLFGLHMPLLRIIADRWLAEFEADPDRSSLTPHEAIAMVGACLRLITKPLWVEAILKETGQRAGLRVRLVELPRARERLDGRIQRDAVQYIEIEAFYTSRLPDGVAVRMLPLAFVAFDRLGQPVGQFAFAVRMDCEVVECELFDEWAFRLSGMLTWALPAIRSEAGRRRR